MRIEDTADGLARTTASSSPSLEETAAGPLVLSARAAPQIERTTGAALDLSGATGSTLLATAVDGAGRPAVTAGLGRGDAVGRYVVVGELGAGGMGVVYAAYDPELDRRVALKLLRPEIGATGGDNPRVRLLREAQALAKLAHPNVVAIHDVGAVGDAVWLAMEFVEGETLRAWSARQRRGWREVLEVMRSAGRGLAAAHVAGLIHRDFKPDNVMVSSDGRVRVMDLGLARRDGAVDSPAGASVVVRVGPTTSGALALDLTHAGAVLGTPAYMAPEQFAGEEVGPAADVFAFCVTFWEALFGERPFAGESYPELLAHVTAGARRAPPRGRTAPRWLRRVVERGLATAPARRWASVQQLLDALDRGQTRARASIAAAGAAIVAAVAGVGWAWQGAERAAKIADCEAAGRSIEAVWDEPARAAVRDGLVKTGLEYAGPTADRVMPWLDRQAEAWRAAKTEVCVAADVAGSWEADARARSDQCLEERRIELASLVATLSRATPQSLKQAIGAAAGLTPVAPCRDRERLAREPLAPVELRARVQAVREALLASGEHVTNGAIDEGLAAARAALAAAEEVAWPPVIAAARLRLGLAQLEKGDLPAAEVSVESAFFAAAEAGAVGVAADAAMFAGRVAHLRARHDEAKRWSRHAALAIRAIEPEPGLRTARRIKMYGQTLSATADYPGARAALEQAVALQEGIFGGAHPELSATLNDLAAVRAIMGDVAEAQALHERALAVAEEVLGPEHPQVAVLTYGMSQLRTEQRAYPEALALAERSLQIFERTFGAGDMKTGGALLQIATIRERLGQFAEARAATERALTVMEGALGPDHPNVAAVLSKLGSMKLRDGDVAGAKQLNERVVAVFERVHGPDHPDVGKAVKNLANTYKALGDVAGALPLYERVLAIREKALGREHALVALSLTDLGKAHLELKQPAKAVPLLARALAIAEAQKPADAPRMALALSGLAEAAAQERRSVTALVERAAALLADDKIQPEERFDVAFRLARALAAADLPRARAFAEQARATIAAIGPASNVADVDAWLAAHPLPTRKR